MSSNEHILQKQFIELLHLHNILVISTDIMDGLKFCGNEKNRFSFISHHKQMGYVKGQPDLIVIIKDAVVFVEMKFDNGRQTKEQKQFEKRVKELVHNYIVLHSWRECEEFVKAITEPSDLEQLYYSIKKLAEMK